MAKPVPTPKTTPGKPSTPKAPMKGTPNKGGKSWKHKL